ncbi:transcriptional regulator [Streptomyces albus]|uniref:transcriptional regulator n=1 Tax=Streptomyces albus TaxID=1888 RepID=UPI003F19FAED
MSGVAAPAAVTLPGPRPAVDDADDVAVLPGLYVPEASQWLSMSSGRIAGDGYSWMQAVHWVAGSGLYEPRRHRSHGPRAFGPTTVVIAQLLSELSPCRPGVEYLVRRTGLAERSVQNHLQILRETGLLAYVVKGTRVRGERAQASEFALMIPAEFDAALGIRTVQRDEGAPAYTRAVSGISEAGRELMAKLAKKASRKVRKPRWKTSSKAAAKASARGAELGVVTAVSDEARCTPMQVGTSTVSSAGDTPLPPESKLASGEAKSPTPKKSQTKAGGCRKLNVVGRRFQLARQLTQELDWLRGCAVPRIAWVARHVADAGWTSTEVRAWLHLRGETARVRRGSGLLAALLAGAETVLDTPAKRTAAVEQWRTAQETARRERIQQVRARTERYEADWNAPTSRAVRREVEAAFAKVKEAANGGPHQNQNDVTDGQALEAELSEHELAQLRTDAWGQYMAGETDLVMTAVNAMGRPAAERTYGAELVQRAHRIASGSHSSLMTYGRR